jgi:dipeptidyl aminopeptidase/acylaminoacyl peptidase
MDMSSSPLSALSKVVTTSRAAYGSLRVGVGVVAIILASSIFIVVPPPLSSPNQQSAYGGTFPGENGLIAFTSNEGEGGYYDIYVMNADGSDVTKLTNNSALDSGPSWSPDGENIAFSSYRDGNYDIYVMNADGSDQTRLTNSDADDSGPSWSPDGEKIAFNIANETAGTRNIYVMNAADGSELERLTSNPAIDGFPSWSPDGEKIAFSSNKEVEPDEAEIFAFEIYVMNADGTGQTRMTEMYDSPAREPSWSPDGEKIAFDSNRDDYSNYDIYVMNAEDGSEQTRLTNFGGATILPDWGTAEATEQPPPEEDTAPPVLTVPEDMVVEANSSEGAEVTYTVTAEDDVDGNATLEEDGTTITQDDVGGDIDISCDPPSGSVFPISGDDDNTEVECSATDEAGNTEDASFTVTVNAPPTTIPAEAIDELISTIQNLDDVPQSVKTSLTAPLKQASDILSDDNPNNDEAACGKLGAFINKVNANEGRGTLTTEQADELRTQAEDIMSRLDC